MELTLSHLDYDLPDDLIAHQPAPQREGARLLVLHRTAANWTDAQVTSLPDLVRPGDLMVLNDTRVVPAKFIARRSTGGAVPGLFLEEESAGRWRVLLQGSRRLRPGETLLIQGHENGAEPMTLHESCGEGEWRVAVTAGVPAHEILERVGSTPLPPYIHRPASTPAHESSPGDRERYQTVYARRPGAVAAPTAGLHLSASLIDQIRQRGVQVAFITLHVGLGTFKPISATRLTDHVMHDERFDIPGETAAAIRDCVARNGRIIAVGTTTTRALESAADPDTRGRVTAGAGTTRLFIRPPFRFRVVDVLMTNFHLPRSTLLAMVMAFAGIDLIRRAYAHAALDRYRFFSYGDAMWIE